VIGAGPAGEAAAELGGTLATRSRWRSAIPSAAPWSPAAAFGPKPSERPPRIREPDARRVLAQCALSPGS